MKINITPVTNAFLALMLAASLSLAPTAFGFAQDGEAYISHISSTESEETGPLNPVGLAFSASSQSFYIVEEPSQGQSLLGNTSEVITITPLGEPEATTNLAALIEDPLNIVFDSRNQRLLAFQPSTGRLVEVREHAGGQLHRTLSIARNAPRLSVQDPAGMTLDEASGDLLILDAASRRIMRVQLGTGRVSEIDLASSGIVAPRGIAFDPSTGHLHVFDLIDQTLYELTQTGQVVNSRALRQFGLKSPQAMVFAPSGDQTDDPAQMSLFVADSGLIPGRGTSSQPMAESDASTETTGQIMEFSMVEPEATAASSFTSVVVNTLDMSTISPPGPDPSGLAYLPSSNSLMVSDGEVEEIGYNITHFQGANVWELTLGGSVIRTANISPVEPTVVPMSDEPTGVAWSSSNGHYYFSDDTGSVDLYDLNPGSDGLVGTSDDTWIGLSLSSYGVGDAEGVAYDSWNNRLWVVDGTNAEVYQFTLSGTLVSQFDVLQYGVADPEAVEFNPDTGTLFVMSSKNTSPVIIETTLTGSLLQTIDISAASARVPAGLAYGPASDGSGARRFYIVDRGYDNNENGNLIDGKLFEMTAPTPGSTPTPSLTFTSTATPPPGGTATNTPTSGARYFSFASNGTVNGLSFRDEDILLFDGQNWSLFFDGSDVGAGGVDLFGFSIMDADTILIAFSANVTLSGMAVTPQDIVRFDATSLGANTAGTFSMYFNGGDVGFDTTAEKIDAVSVLADGRLLISTTGNPSVPGVAGRDEDVLIFTPSSLGPNTSGTWGMYFDASDVGLSDSSEDIDALQVANGSIYLSTSGAFAVSGVTGAGEDVFMCTPISLGDTSACNFNPALFFDGSGWGLSGNNLDGFFLGESNSTPPVTSTSTNTPTLTATGSPTPTFTPTQTSLFTPTNSLTPTATLTPTQTLTPTSTFTPSSTPTHTPTNVPSDNSFFASFAGSGTVGGVSFADEDILYFDGQSWSLFFDGSDVGAGSPDLIGMSFVDADTILMSFSPSVTLDGIAFTPQDIVRFDATSLGPNTAGAFSLYFNGIDVGLDTSGETIDAFSVLPDGRILISTTVDSAVTNVAGKDEDILEFTPTSLGTNTSGTWALYFDGSDVGLSNTTGEDIDAIDVVSENIYLSTNADFSVDGAAGAGEDVFICVPVSLGNTTTCNFVSALFFDGSAWGLTGNSLDGFSLGIMSSALASLGPTSPEDTSALLDPFTSTPTISPTSTPTPAAISTDTPAGP